MALMRIQLGAEADIATSGELKDGLDGLASKLTPKRDPRPIRKPLANFQTMPANLIKGQTFTLDLGTPGAGRIWKLTRVTVVGLDDNTAIANCVAAVYIGDISNAPALLTQLAIHGQGVPYTQGVNDKFAEVHDRENLFVQFTATGAVTAQMVGAVANVLEFPDCVIDAQSI